METRTATQAEAKTYQWHFDLKTDENDAQTHPACGLQCFRRARVGEESCWLNRPEPLELAWSPNLLFLLTGEQVTEARNVLPLLLFSYKGFESMADAVMESDSVQTVQVAGHKCYLFTATVGQHALRDHWDELQSYWTLFSRNSVTTPPVTPVTDKKLGTCTPSVAERMRPLFGHKRGRESPDDECHGRQSKRQRVLLGDNCSSPDSRNVDLFVPATQQAVRFDFAVTADKVGIAGGKYHLVVEMGSCAELVTISAFESDCTFI